MSIDRIGLNNSFGVGGGLGAKAKKAPEEKVEEKKAEVKQSPTENKPAEEVLGFMAANAGLSVGASSSIQRALKMAESASPKVIAGIEEMMARFEQEVADNMVAVQKELGLSEEAARTVALEMAEGKI